MGLKIDIHISKAVTKSVFLLIFLWVWLEFVSRRPNSDLFFLDKEVLDEELDGVDVVVDVAVAGGGADVVG